MDEGMRVKEGENTMGNYTREEVLQMAEDEDVEFIPVSYTHLTFWSRFRRTARY